MTTLVFANKIEVGALYVHHSDQLWKLSKRWWWGKKLDEIIIKIALIWKEISRVTTFVLGVFSLKTIFETVKLILLVHPVMTINYMITFSTKLQALSVVAFICEVTSLLVEEVVILIHIRTYKDMGPGLKYGRTAPVLGVITRNWIKVINNNKKFTNSTYNPNLLTYLLTI